ncbi:MAG TPA: ATP-binding protein [Polyangiaceae bacterium]|nr:ATP-binding protein [Polyangiaceae bacterium]
MRPARAKTISNESLLRAVFENSRQAFMILDRQRRLLLFNRVCQAWAREMLGLELRAGVPFDELFSRFDRHEMRRLFEQVLSGASHTSVTAVPKPDGSTRWFEATHEPVVGDEGDIIGLSIGVLDVTERMLAAERRRHLEDQVRHAQRMESVGRLAGGIAHDFNNLLTVMLSSCSLLLSREHDEAECRRRLQEIQGAAERSAGLTRQLLAFSRKQVLSPRVLGLNDCVHGVRTILERLLGEQVTLDLRLSGDLWDVSADPSQLEQVLVNLVANARDAITGPGSVTIATHNRTGVPAAAMEAGDYVVLSVADTGSGIPDELVKHVFEPFFTTKEPGKGTGLGLATVYGIVKQSGGEVLVEPRGDRGTRFEVWLPRFVGEVAAEPRSSGPTEVAGGTETVLLVEDDDMVRRSVLAILRSLGYRVLTASSAAEALGIFAHHCQDVQVVLSDVGMPGVSGPELILQLRQRGFVGPALLMSGYAEQGIVKAPGVDDARLDFVQKPFGPLELSNKLRSLIDRGQR